MHAMLLLVEAQLLLVGGKTRVRIKVSPSLKHDSFALPSLPWDTRRRSALCVLYLWRRQHGGGVSFDRWSRGPRERREWPGKVSAPGDHLLQEIARGPLHVLHRVPWYCDLGKISHTGDTEEKGGTALSKFRRRAIFSTGHLRNF